jgi:hypothetical protein
MNPEREARERARVAQIMQDDNAIFVFGSNEAGIHGAGAAKDAANLYGAIIGIGEGLMGRSYAIPTKRTPDGDVLTLPEIRVYAERFLEFAVDHPELTFALTRVGCGLAGYRDEQITRLFLMAPENVKLPEGWRRSSRAVRFGGRDPSKR